MNQQLCNAPIAGTGLSNMKVSSARRFSPFVLGGAGAAFLVALYMGIVTWAQGWSHAAGLLGQDWYFVSAIAGGFGMQIGLYAYLRLVVHHSVKLAASTAATGAGTGTSSLAMVACCLHHVTDVLPLLGLSGAAVFLNDYRVPFMLVGLAVNLVGIAIMVKVVRQGRAHLRFMTATTGQAT